MRTRPDLRSTALAALLLLAACSKSPAPAAPATLEAAASAAVSAAITPAVAAAVTAGTAPTIAWR